MSALVLAAGSAAAFTEADHASLELPLAADAQREAAAARPFTPAGLSRAAGFGAGWQVQIDPISGYVRMARGGTISLGGSIQDEGQAETLARRHLFAYPDLLGVRSDNSELRNVRHSGDKWAVHFQQEIDGIPVWKASAFVLMSSGGQVAAFGSDFRPEPDGVPGHPTLSESAAIAAAAASIGATPRADRPQSAELFWVPAPAGELLELALAYRTLFETDEPFGKWETFVHGTTGEILGRRNMFFPINITGTTTGQVAANPPSYGWCDGFSTYPFEHMNIAVSGGNTAPSDALGNFDVPHGGVAPVNVTAQFSGPFSNVNRFSGLGADASQTIAATPGNPISFVWNVGNSRDDERTTFYSANVVHDFMKAIDNTFTELDYAMPSVIGRTDGFCPGNAWWDGFSMNFCAQGSLGGTTYYNTGTLGNVIYHEFGHGVTQEVYQRNGAFEPPGGLHEGNSDVLANFIDRNPYIGLGFSSSTGCASGIRNAVNSLTWPAFDEDGGHTAGQVIAGFHWLAWQSLLAAMPQTQADDIAFHTWHDARDMGTPQTFPDQVEWVFLADDDDANLGNGTPNYDHFCPAAEAKGFTCPEILVGVFINHTELPISTDGGAGFDVVATVTSTEASVDGSSVKTFYRLDGGAFVELAMTSTGNPDEYSAHIPAINGSAEVEYYISAMDLLGNSRTSPANAPTDLHAFDVVWTYDSLESGIAGWTVGLPSDDAASGDWGLFDPVGTAAQPGDDATPAPGVLCFITGQCGPGHGSCTGCDLGCNDVDLGTTTLVSPAFDLTGATSAKLKYARWYSNNTGAAPNEDFWVVQVSNNNGTTWVTVENTNVSAATWTDIAVDLDALFGTLGIVKVRFIASDLGAGSLVEAGVDELRILASFGATDAPVVGEAAAPLRLALDPVQPNPFQATTRVNFAVPARSEVRLAVYDLLGREVRTILSGARDAGSYAASWDGRAGDGSRVAAGVYFFRLTANGEALTRKVTVLK